MAAQFAHPHYQARTNGPSHTAPNAALLIDFDNVTMGIRSDLSKELKSLLNSDIIKGKVAVQRAYADWRRYPQYIVPLAEASVDLIFAPAYGSAKKNATDIRLAIDALELVFTRPEIGTFILLSGDSDFSSLVLKLKEYGKYVIGVGIRESASDLLVQNCDEYYSYSVLSGLTKSDEERQRLDPWELVERAVRQMAARRDVMRSDRLKQVMLELDSSFNEKELGYSKFSRFLADAVGRDRLLLKKGPNGQWEVSPPEADGSAPVAEEPQRMEARPSREETRGRRGGRGRDHDRGNGERASRVHREEQAAAPSPRVQQEPVRQEPAQQEAPTQREPAPSERSSAGRAAEATVDVRRQPVPEAVVAEVAGAPRGDLRAAYDLLRRAVENLTGKNGDAARDSDVKRRMLEMQPGWDESTLGFSKFSRFLRQAHDAEAIDLHRMDGGSYQVTLSGGRARKPVETPRHAGRGPSAKAAGPSATMENVAKDDAAPVARSEAPVVRETTPARSTEAGPRAPATEESAKAPMQDTVAAKGDAPVAKPVASAAQVAAPEAKPTAATPKPEPRPEATRQPDRTTAAAAAPRGLGARLGTRGRAAPMGPPPLLPGQAVGIVEEKVAPAAPAKPEPKDTKPTESKAAPRTRSGAAQRRGAKPAVKAEPRATPVEAAKATPAAEQKEVAPEAQVAPAGSLSERLGMPTDADGVRSYILGRYKGVGHKTVDALVEAFGATDLFGALDASPERVREVLGGSRRADLVLDAWKADRAQRAELAASKPATESAAKPASRSGKPAAKRTARPAAKAAKPATSSSRPAKDETAGAGAASGAKAAKKAGARTGRGKPKAKGAIAGD
jgi:uncharacterized protein (TIGR00288 family)